ncbi:MAG: glycosyltransferase, partial [Deltaproteobacteria bacterium]|nr:glycosyltransferase [Deltaproteobacteria bacterium]
LAQPLVFDLYDPLFLEASERQPTPATRYFQAVFRERLRLMFARGDLFLTSNDRQKDLYLHLAADLSLPREESRFVTVPFGVRGRGEKEPHGWLRQRWPQIEPGDKIFLWNGGIYPWLDFDTLMHAWARIGMDRADLKLVFLGTGHPGGDREICALERQAKQQAQELGLLGRLVFFNDEWVPYERYPDYVGEADVVVCTHRQTGESRFALRSRLLDAVANGVPILCSNGDVVGEMVRERGFGLGVAPESVAELVAAACRLADDREFWQRCRQNLLASRWEFDWGKVTAPLQAFCRSPQLAADKPAYSSYLWLLARVVLKVGAHSVRIRGWRATFRAMLRKVREA